MPPSVAPPLSSSPPPASSPSTASTSVRGLATKVEVVEIDLTEEDTSSLAHAPRRRPWTGREERRSIHPAVGCNENLGLLEPGVFVANLCLRYGFRQLDREEGVLALLELKVRVEADPHGVQDWDPADAAGLAYSGTVPSQQNSALTPDGNYRAPLLGGVPSAGYLDTTYGYDSTWAQFAWYDGSAYANGQQRTTTTNRFPSSSFSGNGSSARYQNKSSTTQQMGMYRPRACSGYYGYGNESQDGTIELNRGPRSGRFKNQKLGVDDSRPGEFSDDMSILQMGRVGEKLDIDFVISTGDNFYKNGLKGVRDQAFKELFMDIYIAQSLQKPWYSELVDFFFVDTTPFQLEYWTHPGKHRYDWRGVAPRGKYIANLLKDMDVAMKRSTARWKIVVGHHTMRSVSEHGDTEELLELLLPVLKDNGVDFYINGHDHCLEHISSRDSPLQYFTSGGGSKAWRGVFHPNKDKLRFFYDGQGFMSLQLNQDQAHFIFYDVFGNILYRWSSRHPQSSTYLNEE
uniref:Calcineurin-like phosphoesterase domain-containing protein n=1 Tax=Zea mays TaxID=4577 RepID=A0A804M264_MAIZE